MSVPDLPVVFCATRAEWEAWLDEHHGDAAGVWLEMAKKGSGIDSVGYADAVAVALCFGWIDSQKAAVDERRWRQRFTPRRPRSRWSKANRRTATELLERGEMRPAGLREVEAARADGRWDAAYDGPREATVPADLQAALDADERAREHFDALDGRNRYAVLHRIQDAKKPETRARRIERFIAMLHEGRTVYP